MGENNKKESGSFQFAGPLVLALAAFLLLVQPAFARPCCSEDPENMTFQILRDRSDYLIGNHLGDDMDFPFNIWFKSSRVNIYSKEGDFVVAIRSASDRLAGYSLYEYKNPKYRIYVQEEAMNRIWHAPEMVSATLLELISGNIEIDSRKGEPPGFSP